MIEEDENENTGGAVGETAGESGEGGGLGVTPPDDGPPADGPADPPEEENENQRREREEAEEAEEADDDLIMQIAIVCHEANRAWCTVRGDNTCVSWNDTDKMIRRATIAGVRDRIAKPLEPISHSHESWVRHKAKEGWKYGPKKNAKLKEHPNMVPYVDLPIEEQKKDALFVGVIKGLYGIA